MSIISATQTHDTLAGAAGDDNITGSRGGDLIDGAAGDDTIDGGAANLDPVGGGDTIHGGEGFDLITGRSGGLIYGEAGGDTVHAYGDALFIVDGGGGDDLIVGQDADVIASYLSAADGVHVSLQASGGQTVGGGMGADTLQGVVGLIGSHYGDTLTGAAVLDYSGGVLVGGDGDDSLTGGAGASNLTPGAGADTVVGQGGASVNYGDFTVDGDVLVHGADSGLTVDLAVSGPQAIGGGMGVDTLINIQGVYGGAYADTLSGTDGGNVLYGGDGGDSLDGRGGDDSLDGGAGNDVLLGGAGDDQLSAGDGDNLAAGGDGADRIFVGTGFSIVNGNAGDDTLNGSFTREAIGHWLRGGQGDDSIVGGAGADFISGDRGDDTVSGGLGADTFHSFSGAGLDRIMDFHQAEGDRVLLDAGTAYTVSQAGDNVVIDLGGGDMVQLMATQLSSLSPGWLVVGG